MTVTAIKAPATKVNVKVSCALRWKRQTKIMTEEQSRKAAATSTKRSHASNRDLVANGCHDAYATARCAMVTR
ncbi:hypothetical protein ANCCEY_11304 [Ancylostoma ceylanicum]|uniref:Uncharacterized protein n=1 Tax=Ancylostoma ceylanicum TaxID=53326 RepID=A0A0D6LEG3_9BILA|nr:hypothetical protein ANCCEY_11304 [Ancylostoma ceylanicum]